MNRHTCTIIYSMDRVDALRTPSRLRVGYPTLLQERGRYDLSRLKAQDQPIATTHFRVGNRVFSHSLDVVSNMYIHIIYSQLFTCTISKTLFEVNHSLFFVVSSDVLNFHGHSQFPCMLPDSASSIMIQLLM